MSSYYRFHDGGLTSDDDNRARGATIWCFASLGEALAHGRLSAARSDAICTVHRLNLLGSLEWASTRDGTCRGFVADFLFLPLAYLAGPASSGIARAAHGDRLAAEALQCEPEGR